MIGYATCCGSHIYMKKSELATLHVGAIAKALAEVETSWQERLRYHLGNHRAVMLGQTFDAKEMA